MQPQIYPHLPPKGHCIDTMAQVAPAHSLTDADTAADLRDVFRALYDGEEWAFGVSLSSGTAANASGDVVRGDETVASPVMMLPVRSCGVLMGMAGYEERRLSGVQPRRALHLSSLIATCRGEEAYVLSDPLRPETLERLYFGNM